MTNSKNDKIIFATKHQPPHDSHRLPFYTFDTFLTQVFMGFFCLFFICTLGAVPPQTSFLSTTPPRVFLSVSDFLSSTSDGFSLRTGSLQHTQVIVLFGGPQFEEAGPTVVKFEGSTLGSRGAGEHCHYCVEVSRVAAVALCSHGGSARRPHYRTATALPSPASLGFLQPLNLGSAHRKLVKEFFSLGTRNPLWQVRYLKYATHNWTKKKWREGCERVQLVLLEKIKQLWWGQ